VRIATKSVYDRKEERDGLRLLITRYWPRGIKKAAFDRWERRVAPSAVLVKAFKHEGLAWPEYRQRYLAEMDSAEARAGMRDIAAAAGRGAVTIICICRDEAHCHRGILKNLLGAGR